MSLGFAMTTGLDFGRTHKPVLKGFQEHKGTSRQKHCLLGAGQGRHYQKLLLKILKVPFSELCLAATTGDSFLYSVKISYNGFAVRCPRQFRVINSGQYLTLPISEIPLNGP